MLSYPHLPQGTEKFFTPWFQLNSQNRPCNCLSERYEKQRLSSCFILKSGELYFHVTENHIQQWPWSYHQKRLKDDMGTVCNFPVGGTASGEPLVKICFSLSVSNLCTVKRLTSRLGGVLIFLLVKRGRGGGCQKVLYDVGGGGDFKNSAALKNILLPPSLQYKQWMQPNDDNVS